MAFYYFNAEMKYKEPPYIPEPFATATDAQIAEALQKHYLDEIDLSQVEGWEVGATRLIRLNAMQAPNPESSKTWSAQYITIVIIGHDHTDLATPINGHSKAAITVQTREVLSGVNAGMGGNVYIDGSNQGDWSFTKWSDNYIRSYLNSTVYNAFSNTFKPLIKSSKHYRHTGYNTSTSEEVTNNIFLLSFPDVFGGSIYEYYTPTNPYEGSRFEYYAISSNNRMKSINNNGSPVSGTVEWWLSSTSSQYNQSWGYYWLAQSNGTAITQFYGAQMAYLAPAWAM